MSESKLSDNYQPVKLKLLVIQHNAGVYKNSSLYGTGTNIVGVSDLYRHNAVDGQEFRRVPLTNEELSLYSLQEGDLIYGESSLVLDGIAKTLYVTKHGSGTAFAWHTRRFKVNRKRVDPSFLNYALHSEKARQQIMAVATQTALTGITTTDFFNTEILLPSPPEQRKIARILSTVDAVIEKTEAAIAKYKAIKAGMMRDLFTRGIDLATGKLRPSHKEAPELYKPSELGWVPKEWEVVRLEEFADVITGSTPPTSNYSNYGDEYMFVSPSDINENQFINKTEKMLSKDGFKLCRIIPENSICVVCIGSTIGKMAFTVKECATNQQINTVIPYEVNLSEYYYYAMLFNNDKQFRKETGLQAVPIVNKTNFAKFKTPSVKENEAASISKILMSVDKQIQKELDNMYKYQQLKQALMSDLLTGKVPVKYEEEKAEVM